MARYDDRTPLSLAHLSELEVPPPALAAMAARAGFASIGVRALPAVPGGTCHPLEDRAARAALRSALAGSGTSLLCIELVPIGRDLAPARLRDALEAGAELGASRLVVTGDDPDRDVVAAGMAALCDIAAPLGMAVDLEFMPFRAVDDLAASFQRAVADVFADRTEHAVAAATARGVVPTALVVAGGVAANAELRARLGMVAAGHGLALRAPPLSLCTDNAAMIAWAGIERLRRGERDGLDAPARPRWPLDPAFGQDGRAT